jgi:hypothetical protein
MKSAQGLLPTSRPVVQTQTRFSPNKQFLVRATLLCTVTMLMLLLTAR